MLANLASCHTWLKIGKNIGKVIVMIFAFSKDADNVQGWTQTHKT